MHIVQLSDSCMHAATVICHSRVYSLHPVSREVNLMQMNLYKDNSTADNTTSTDKYSGMLAPNYNVL